MRMGTASRVAGAARRSAQAMPPLTPITWPFT